MSLRIGSAVVAALVLVSACTSSSEPAASSDSEVTRNITLSTIGRPSPLRPPAPLIDSVVTVPGLEIDMVRPVEVATYSPVGWVDPVAITSFRSRLWVVDKGTDRLVCWDPRSEASCGSVDVGEEPIGVTSHGGRLWVLSSGDDRVDVVDPVSMTLETFFRVEFAAQSIREAHGDVWLVNNSIGSLTRLDYSTYGTMTTDPGIAYPSYLYDIPTDAVEDLDRGVLWVTEGGADVVSRANLAGRKEASISVPGGPVTIDYDGTSLWVGSQDDEVVTRIAPRFGVIVDTIELSANPTEILVSDEVVWVTHRAANRVTAISVNDTDRVWTLSSWDTEGATLERDGDLWVVGGGDTSEGAYLRHFTS